MEDEMDSLFEGMVLFTPAQLSPEQPPSPERPAPRDHPQQEDVPLQSVASEPLEENLFSDLTISRDVDVSRSSGIDIPVASSNGEGMSKEFSSVIQSDNNDLEASRDLENAETLGASTMSSVLQVENEETVGTEGSGDRKELDDVVESDDAAEEKFEKLKEQISSKLDNSRMIAASLSTARKECVRRRRKAAESLSSIIQRGKSLDALRDAEAECDAIDVKMDEVLRARIIVEEEGISLMEDFSADAAACSELIVSMAELQYLERMDRWLSSSEAVEGTKIELDIESFVINEASQVLNGSIDHSVEDDRRQREALLKKRDVLHSELEELLALVQQKEREIAENDANIELVEQRIDEIASGFRDSLQDVEETKDILKSNLAQVDTEEEKGSKIRGLAKLAADEAKVYRETAGLRKDLMQSILNFREIKQGLGMTQEKLSEGVQTLRPQASTARASLQELSSTKSSLQQEVASFEQRIVFVDKRLPELESKKKVAASARNFKEAGRIAAEAKSLITEKESLQNQLEKATSELDMLDEKIMENIEDLQDAENLILLKEREVAIALAQFRRLLAVATAAKAERTAALELGDEEEANLLLLEMEAAELEAGKLQTSYNFKYEDVGNLPRAYVPIELVSNLTAKQLADLVASRDLHAASQDNAANTST
ncbi:hypothetical protein MLD38_022133 [Melastoma candidum]|uniref:Uncharacterized protein n=1 Tax=Melastoma candidum TaxID=119954 RepID=A0ACB9QJH1_9MYRT|nr:hypothetical protein MLD38_022133 [Melastoma candidum]